MMVAACPNSSSLAKEDGMIRGAVSGPWAPGCPADHVQAIEKYRGTTMMDSTGPVIGKTVVDDLPLFFWTISGASWDIMLAQAVRNTGEIGAHCPCREQSSLAQGRAHQRREHLR
jgi:hypothetical protein